MEKEWTLSEEDGYIIYHNQSKDICLSTRDSLTVEQRKFIHDSLNSYRPWIPVSEKPKGESDTFEVTVEFNSKYITSAFFNSETNEWEDLHSGDFENVIAWRELDEPFKG